MLVPRIFTRKKEDFTCAHCLAAVRGDGYTDHCPHCLWSRHVDVFPGDRAEVCRGMMRPVGVEKSGDRFRIIKKCERCGAQRISRSVPSDNFEAVLSLVQETAASNTNINKHALENARN